MRILFFFSKVENFSRYASLGDGGGGGERERKKRNYTHIDGSKARVEE